jgi:Ca2+-binding EF-hand superfamily protein
MISGIGGASASYDVQDAAAMRKQMFQKLDQNGDGKVTKDEMSAAQPQDGQGPSVDEIFSQVDTNQDGSIDESENDAFLQQMEANRPPGPPPDASKMAEELFKKADADSDGKITKDELAQALPQNGKGPSVDDIFKDADTDGDGTISQSELEASMKKAQEHMPARSRQSSDEENASQWKLSYDNTGAATETSALNLLSVVA